MKNWVCEECGHLAPPGWKKRDNFPVLVAFAILTAPILIPFFLLLGRGVDYGSFKFEGFAFAFKMFFCQKVCPNCGGKVLYPADSDKGQEVLGKFYEARHGKDPI